MNDYVQSGKLKEYWLCFYFSDDACKDNYIEVRQPVSAFEKNITFLLQRNIFYECKFVMQF